MEKEMLTFDDVLLKPQYSEIESRRDVSLVTNFTKKYRMSIPIISANMDTITEFDMVETMSRLGGVGILHRFMSLEHSLEIIDRLCPKDISILSVSVGVNDDVEERLEAYNTRPIDVICIDVAHGWCLRVEKLIGYIKRKYPHWDIIAGNVATADGAIALVNMGVDAIKVGIGPGSLCTTRIVTGHGVPQLSAIQQCSPYARERGVAVIADGGVKNSGDIVKALAAGADSVMVGSLLAGSTETPGEIIDDIKTHQKYKKYRGMASDDAMTGWKGEYHAAPEGESTLVPLKGSASKIVNKLVMGIKSGLSYSGATNIGELQESAVFLRVTPSSLRENIAHGK
jgi:IMP dehydrogenase